jgi:uncharacterized protein
VTNFSVNILGLSKKEHSFDFHLSETFFAKYGKEVVSGGDFDAKVILNKRETLIEADFKIQGKAHLICDRSLDPFDHPMEIDKKVIFKYGDVAGEISDEIIVVPHDLDVLDVGQLMYEFIVLDIPIKKIHPRFENDDDEIENEEGKLIYQTEKDETAIDPRWEALKKLKQ